MSRSSVPHPSEQIVRRVRWSRILAGLFVLATVWKVWLGDPQIVTPAFGQIPDSGLQRKLMIDEARKTNQLLSEILTLLKSGQLKVQIDGTDKRASTLRPGGRR